MKSYRKGQAAMEYLMTYGWAILVILVVIGVLYWMGILNPKAPEACTFKAGFSCASYQLTPTTFSLKLGQATGKSIRVTDVGCSSADNIVAADGTVTWANIEGDDALCCDGACCTGACDDANNVATIPNGESRDMPAALRCCKDGEVVSASNTPVGDQFKGKVYVRYVDLPTNTVHVSIGDLVLGMEPG